PRAGADEAARRARWTRSVREVAAALPLLLVAELLDDVAAHVFVAIALADAEGRAVVAADRDVDGAGLGGAGRVRDEGLGALHRHARSLLGAEVHRVAD